MTAIRSQVDPCLPSSRPTQAGDGGLDTGKCGRIPLGCERHRLASAQANLPPKMKGTTKGPFPQGRPGCNGGLAPSIRRHVVGHQINGAASAWSASATRTNSFWPGPNGRHDTARTASILSFVGTVVIDEEGNATESAAVLFLIFPRQEIAEVNSLVGILLIIILPFSLPHRHVSASSTRYKHILQEALIDGITPWNLLFPWKRTLSAASLHPDIDRSTTAFCASDAKQSWQAIYGVLDKSIA